MILAFQLFRALIAGFLLLLAIIPGIIPFDLWYVWTTMALGGGLLLGDSISRCLEEF